jgi:hemolysin activation/secretion protein
MDDQSTHEPARFRRNRIPLGISLGIALTAAVAHAQTPPDAGAQFSEQQRLQKRLPDHIPSFDQGEIIRPALTDRGGTRITLQRIQFSGAVQLVPEAELLNLIKDAIGQELDFAGLEALAQRVTDYLKKQGYLLARAYLPRQDITDGQLEIAILAGKLESRNEPVKIIPGGKLALRIDPARLQAIATKQLQSGAVVHDEDLQRAMLLLNDLPGISARSRLEPGSEADTTRVVVDVEQAPMLTLTASLDNYGNRYTGDSRAVISLQADGPLGLGDRVALSVTHAELSDQAQFNFSLPVGDDGLRMGLSATHLESQTGKEFAASGIEAASDTYGLNLSYPVIRTRQRNLWLNGALDRRRYTDSAKGLITNQRQTRPLSLGVSGDLLDGWAGGGFNQAGLALVGGTLAINEPLSRTGDQTQANSQGRYHKWTWNLSRLQRIDGPLTLLLTANGQISCKNLDSSEKFALGGPTALRAYAGGEASGDTGYFASAELRYELPAGSLGQWQFSGFLDHGQITLHHTEWFGAVNNVTGSNRYRLNGAGLGVSLSKPGSHTLRFVLARRIGDNPGRTTAGKDSDGLNDTTRAWLQALFWF